MHWKSRFRPNGAGRASSGQRKCRYESEGAEHGFWFPAWGYFPGAYYPYDGPIYGYNGLTPDQVVVNAQVQLQRDGYYAGPIDGVLGPMTRHALAAFQADHGLAVTAAIDEATASTLGLT